MSNLKPPAVQFQLSADVADAGTFTVGYPTGFSDGQFENASGNYIMFNGKKLLQPADIGLSFGDTAVTVTNRTGGVLPAGQMGYIQYAVLGKQTKQYGSGNINPTVRRVRAVEMPGLLIDLGAPVTADADGVCASQSITAGTAALLNGALLNVAGTGMVFDVPRNVVASWTTTSVLIVIGKDEYGNVMEERSASGTSHTGKKAFKSITSVNTTISVTSATVGTGDVLGLPVRIPAEINVLEEREGGVVTEKKLAKYILPFACNSTETLAGTSKFVISPVAGTVTEMNVVTTEVVTTGGTVSAKIATVAITGISIVVIDTSAAGVVQNDVSTGANTVTAGQAIEFVGDAAFATAGAIAGNFVVVPTTRLAGGVLVAGLAKDTKSTTTAADVRGTYDPITACDGTTNFQLLVRLAQPDDLGNPQYHA